mgnify:CR=1 FL=1|jgi:hypothetical protein
MQFTFSGVREADYQPMHKENLVIVSLIEYRREMTFIVFLQTVVIIIK